MAKWTVQRPVASYMDGRPVGYHKFWTVMVDGDPVGPQFKTKAEATYYFWRHYAPAEGATLDR